jgi:hypothetical protein
MQGPTQAEIAEAMQWLQVKSLSWEEVRRFLSACAGTDFWTLAYGPFPDQVRDVLGAAAVQPCLMLSVLLACGAGRRGFGAHDRAQAAVPELRRLPRLR